MPTNFPDDDDNEDEDDIINIDFSKAPFPANLTPKKYPDHVDKDKFDPKLDWDDEDFAARITDFHAFAKDMNNLAKEIENENKTSDKSHISGDQFGPHLGIDINFHHQRGQNGENSSFLNPFRFKDGSNNKNDEKGNNRSPNHPTMRPKPEEKDEKPEEDGPDNDK